MPFQVSRTLDPSTVVCCDLDNYQFFRANTRTQSLFSNGCIEIAAAALDKVISLDQEAQAISAKFGPNHYIKLRHLYIDDKNADFTIHVDYIHDKNEKPIFTESDIKLFLGNGTVCHLGQAQYVEVSIKTALFSSDYFSPIADEYYKTEL